MDMILTINTDRPYDVIVENGALGLLGERVKPLFKAGSRAMIVSDTNVFPIYGEAVAAQLRAAGFEVFSHVFEAGEARKTLDSVAQIYASLAKAGFTRSDFVVTLGGGVAGDMGGFAAATFLRGIEFVQIPTSLLAQVDASVGGKTAVDLPDGKNLVGAFHQPRLVIADPKTLDTLPEDFFVDGMGEVVKHGCILDPVLFDALEHGTALDRLETMIARNIACKKMMVEEDTRDRGRRMILNFGHTFGHAIEKLTDLKLSHGRAVSVGMVLAAEVGEGLRVTPAGLADRIRGVLADYGLPTKCPFDFAEIIEATALDKKSFGKTLNLILLEDIGKAVIRPVDRSYLVLRHKLAAEQSRRNVEENDG